MLPSSYAPCEYSFLIQKGEPNRLVFVSNKLQEQARTQPTEPFWYLEVQAQRTLDALIRWIRVRRAEWPAWGKLAQTAGRPALATLMSRLLREEAPAEVTGVLIKSGDREDQLAVGEILAGPAGISQRIFYTHSFGGANERDAFRQWLLSNNPEGNGNALLEIALNDGTDRLGAKMNAIASQELESARE
jgi:hypothetical protein